MMGFYPDNATDPSYTFASPVFDKITLTLNPDYYGKKELVIETKKTDDDAQYINSITIDGKSRKGYRISHNELVNAGKITFDLSSKK
jgi:putative alpha-1,2-mannosidase